MPLYQYKCDLCNHQFEEFKSISNREVPKSQPCPSCWGLGSVDQMVCAPMVCDPIRVRGIPVNGQLRDKLQQIHSLTHGSVLNTASTLTKI